LQEDFFLQVGHLEWHRVEHLKKERQTIQNAGLRAKIEMESHILQLLSSISRVKKQKE